MTAAEFRTFLGRGASAASPRAARAGRSRRPRLEVLSSKASGAAFSELPLRFVLPFLPPSVNNLFVTVKDDATGATRRVLGVKARKAREAIARFVHGRLSRADIFELHITVELDAVTKSGNVRKIDLSNRLKFLEDCVSRCLDIDDRQFFRIVLNKLHADHERTVIAIVPFGSLPDRPD